MRNIEPICAAFLAACVVAPAAASELAVGFAGTWNLTIDGGGEQYFATLSVRQADGQSKGLRGDIEYEGKRRPLRTLERKANTVRFVAVLPSSSGDLQFDFRADLIGAKMRGAVDMTSPTGSRTYDFRGVTKDLATRPTEAAGPSTSAPAVRKILLRQGLDGYDAAIDAEVWAIAPTRVLLDQGTMTCDGNNGGGESQVLMRFGNLLGQGPRQIPPGSRVRSATLTVVAFDPGTTVHLHAILVPWPRSATWDLLDGGLSIDDVEASTKRDGFTFGEIVMDKQEVGFDVTETVQAWADGTLPQHGWVFVNTGGNGWDFYSSDWVEPSLRPRLSVEFEPPRTAKPKD